ncbi:sulfotransferase family protein [Altererythrobacter sp. GH1-8]|uniref:sulfotransferase family protein n=1 Tax=Altererythrobacter sp. GH1-8 TaxID=3349333 RepID=UPI00374D1C13
MSSAPSSRCGALTRPTFIVSSPRSGSTLLFQTLAQAPGLATIGNESHGLIEGIPAFHPASHEWHSNRLTADDLDPRAVEEMSRRFLAMMRGRDGQPAAPTMHLLEKTPKNSLRVPLLASAYPDARFVFLYREARPTLASMIEAWRSGRFRTYPRLPGWRGPDGLPWSLLLVPGWRELVGQPLAEIVAHQWTATIDILLADLEALPQSQVHVVSYQRFLADPQASMEDICSWLGEEWDRQLPAPLPLSRFTVSPPSPDKWKRYEAEIESVWPLVQRAECRSREFIEKRE